MKQIRKYRKGISFFLTLVFSIYAGKIRQLYLKKSATAMQEHSLRQNIPLSVWLESTPGHWERAGYFNLPGPVAFKSDVLPIDLSKVKGDVIRIRLSSGFMFWEIDSVGMDFSADQPVTVHDLEPLSAIDQAGADLTAALRNDDTLYYHQPEIGDEAIVSFQAPPLPAGMQRSLILHSKGHYEIRRAPAPGKPSVRYLKQFAKPNAFPVFARAQWLAMMRENKLAEPLQGIFKPDP